MIMGLFSGLVGLGFDVLTAKVIYDVEAQIGGAYERGFEDGNGGHPKQSFELRQKLRRLQRQFPNPSDRALDMQDAMQNLIDAYEEGYQDGQSARRF